jgi:hypothetical protein
MSFKIEHQPFTKTIFQAYSNFVKYAGELSYLLISGKGT